MIIKKPQQSSGGKLEHKFGRSGPDSRAHGDNIELEKILPIIFYINVINAKSDHYKNLEYQYNIKKYDRLRVYLDCSIGNLVMKPSNNKYIITGNIDYNSTLAKPIVKLTNKSNISRLDLKIKADKIIKTSEKIASDEWEKAGKPTPPGDPYEKIYNKPRPEGDGGEGDIQDLSDITSKAATIKARKKYSTTLEFPTGITDFFQDKLRISVLKFEPAETK